MNRYIVTIKLPRNPDHNPKNKKTGFCPVSNHCSDSTGEHHSYIDFADTQEQIIDQAKDRGFSHVTRIEQIEG